MAGLLLGKEGTLDRNQPGAPIHARLAQRIELLAYIQGVGGSNPSASTTPLSSNGRTSASYAAGRGFDSPQGLHAAVVQAGHPVCNRQISVQIGVAAPILLAPLCDRIVLPRGTERFSGFDPVSATEPGHIVADENSANSLATPSVLDTVCRGFHPSSASGGRRGSPLVLVDAYYG